MTSSPALRASFNADILFAFLPLSYACMPPASGPEDAEPALPARFTPVSVRLRHARRLDDHSMSRTSNGGLGSAPAPSRRARIRATYAVVSGIGGTQPQAATGPGPAL